MTLKSDEIKTPEAQIVTQASEFVNIMLDLETLGTSAGCKILSISGVTFNTSLSTRNHFDCPVRIGTQDLLKTDPDTEEWWKKQSKEAQDAAFNNENAVSIVKALGYFTDWIESMNHTPIIWCKGAGFDDLVLGYAYKVYGMKTPWDFRNVRCYRTLEALFKHLIQMPEFIGVKHTSLADALNQANYAEKLMSILPLECNPHLNLKGREWL